MIYTGGQKEGGPKRVTGQPRTQKLRKRAEEEERGLDDPHNQHELPGVQGGRKHLQVM